MFRTCLRAGNDTLYVSGTLRLEAPRFLTHSVKLLRSFISAISSSDRAMKRCPSPDSNRNVDADRSSGSGFLPSVSSL